MRLTASNKMKINEKLPDYWTLTELLQLYEIPLLELIWQAQQAHQHFHENWEVQVCQLISIKTGGCLEDCKYCAQSSRYQTGTKPTPLISLEEVRKIAQQAIAQGVTRVCLGAGWRGVKEGKIFDQILQMIRELNGMGVEVCCTLGLLNAECAKRLADEGLYAYNHNLDTSEAFYPHIITTRTYQDRLNTIKHVQKAGISVCCGGIIGMGETINERLELILTLANLSPQPDSVPINRLISIPGTPLQDLEMVSIWEFVRLIAITRLVMPKTMIRLSAGRLQLSAEQQALCFLAGANSIFSGDKLLTTDNPSFQDDQELFSLLGLTIRPSHASNQVKI